jgi:hypothetical protein
MTWFSIICLVIGAFATGFAAGSAFTWWAVLGMVMKIDDARAEGSDWRP